MNDENKPLNDAEDNKALDSQENAVPNAEKASEAPRNNTEKEKTEANNRPTGKPSTLQDKWCNFLVAIGLLGVIAVGAHNIFHIPEETMPAEQAPLAEPIEEAEDEGELIDEELMPLPPAKETTPVDTLQEASEENLNNDSLHALPADTTTMHPVSSSKSKSSSRKIGALKSSSARRSFFVGRPVPFARPTNPLMRLISSTSYCSGAVMFSRISGRSLAPTRFSMACFTLNV